MLLAAKLGRKNLTHSYVRRRQISGRSVFGVHLSGTNCSVAVNALQDPITNNIPYTPKILQQFNSDAAVSIAHKLLGRPNVSDPAVLKEILQERCSGRDCDIAPDATGALALSRQGKLEGAGELVAGLFSTVKQAIEQHSPSPSGEKTGEQAGETEGEPEGPLVCLCVPPGTSPEQRRVIAENAQSAGLKVIKVVSHQEAAIHNQPYIDPNCKYLVVHFGEDLISASLIHINGGEMSVIEETAFGDIEEALVTLLSQKLEKQLSFNSKSYNFIRDIAHKHLKTALSALSHSDSAEIQILGKTITLNKPELMNLFAKIRSPEEIFKRINQILVNLDQLDKKTNVLLTGDADRVAAFMKLPGNDNERISAVDEGSVVLGAAIAGSNQLRKNLLGSGSPRTHHNPLYKPELFQKTSTVFEHSRFPIPFPSSLEFRQLQSREYFEYPPLYYTKEELKQASGGPLPVAGFAMCNNPWTGEVDYYVRLGLEGVRVDLEKRPSLELHIVVDLTEPVQPFVHDNPLRNLNSWEEYFDHLKKTLPETEYNDRMEKHKNNPPSESYAVYKTQQFGYTASPANMKSRMAIDFALSQLTSRDKVAVSIRGQTQMHDLTEMSPLLETLENIQSALNEFETLHPEELTSFGKQPNVQECLRHAAALYPEPLPDATSVERRVLVLTDGTQLFTSKTDRTDFLSQANRNVFLTVATLDGAPELEEQSKEWLAELKGATYFSFEGLGSDALFLYRNSVYPHCEGAFIRTLVPRYMDIKMMPFPENYEIEKVYGNDPKKGSIQTFGTIVGEIPRKAVNVVNETGKRFYDGYPVNEHPMALRNIEEPWKPPVMHRRYQEVESEDPTLNSDKVHFILADPHPEGQKISDKLSEKEKMESLSPEFWEALVEDINNEVATLLKDYSNYPPTLHLAYICSQRRRLKSYNMDCLLLGTLKWELHKLNREKGDFTLEERDRFLKNISLKRPASLKDLTRQLETVGHQIIDRKEEIGDEELEDIQRLLAKDTPSPNPAKKKKKEHLNIEYREIITDPLKTLKEEERKEKPYIWKINAEGKLTKLSYEKIWAERDEFFDNLSLGAQHETEHVSSEVNSVIEDFEIHLETKGTIPAGRLIPKDDYRNVKVRRNSLEKKEKAREIAESIKNDNDKAIEKLLEEIRASFKEIKKGVADIDNLDWHEVEKLKNAPHRVALNGIEALKQRLEKIRTSKEVPHIPKGLLQLPRYPPNLPLWLWEKKGGVVLYKLKKSQTHGEEAWLITPNPFQGVTTRSTSTINPSKITFVINFSDRYHLNFTSQTKIVQVTIPDQTTFTPFYQDAGTKKAIALARLSDLLQTISYGQYQKDIGSLLNIQPVSGSQLFPYDRKQTEQAKELIERDSSVYETVNNYAKYANEGVQYDQYHSLIEKYWDYYIAEFSGELAGGIYAFRKIQKKLFKSPPLHKLDYNLYLMGRLFPEKFMMNKSLMKFLINSWGQKVKMMQSYENTEELGARLGDHLLIQQQKEKYEIRKKRIALQKVKEEMLLEARKQEKAKAKEAKLKAAREKLKRYQQQ